MMYPEDGDDKDHDEIEQNLKEDLSGFIITNIIDDYFYFSLLQAMALSPDPGKSMASIITSSAINSNCQLLNYTITDTNFDSYIEKIKSLGIKFVAHGHVPHCNSIPLIYKYKDVIFLSIDTSNGNRRLNIEDDNLENVPLTFISRKGNTFNVGISSLKEEGILSSEKTRVSQFNEINNNLIGSFNENTVPVLLNRDDDIIKMNI
jgi:hypothetical protein